jgi:hypothetical protein
LLLNVNLYIDDQLYQNKEFNKEILEKLKCNSYVKLNFFLISLKRSQVYDKQNPSSTLIHIYNKEKNPEYFNLSDIKIEEVSINKRKRKLSITIDDKRRKVSNDINWSEMVSASSVRNYFLNAEGFYFIKPLNLIFIYDSFFYQDKIWLLLKKNRDC